MKVICDRAALLEAVNLVAGVVSGRTPTPVLQCIKLTAADGTLTLAATDLEIGLRIGVDQVDVQKAGEALLPADKLVQITRASEDPTLTIEVKDHAVHIRGADSHFKVFGYDPKEAPAVREFGDVKVDCEIDGGVLRTLIARTLFAAAAEHSRYAINGVLFEREGRKLRLVATDGRRLAMARGECKPVAGPKEGKVTCIVPTKALSLLGKLISDPEATVRMANEENQAIFAVGSGTDAAVLSTNLVEGAFPPFEDVIPKDQDKKVTFDCATLSSAIRRAALLTNEESKGVRMSFADKKLTVTSRAPEMGEAEIHVDLNKYEGDPLDIGFNPQYISDALKVVDGAEVIVELKAPNKPGVLRTGSEFTYVIMPVNLQ
ncbi:MAG TPA: DNA polymerase III subunit beta [Phycisphaerales bacterium]|nr:DNA polymerase III subunit beta [Phycisphaerales bacterium]